MYPASFREKQLSHPISVSTNTVDDGVNDLEDGTRYSDGVKKHVTI